MSAVVLAPRTTAPAWPRTFAGLARHELRRFVVNPVFLVGAGFITTAMVFPNPSITDLNEATPHVAIFVGGFGMMATYWQARSLRPTAQVVDATPAPLPLRTAALCTVAVVPLLVGIVDLMIFRQTVTVAGDWVYGAFDVPTRSAVLVSQFVLPALGGPLLGIALGRWVSFPGAGFVTFLLLFGWQCVGILLSETASRDDTAVVTVRFLAPFAYFTLHEDAGSVTTWRGSPWFFLGWQFALCVIAVLVALLRGADGPVRRRLTRTLWTALLVAGVLLALTVAGGHPHSVVTP